MDVATRWAASSTIHSIVLSSFSPNLYFIIPNNTLSTIVVEHYYQKILSVVIEENVGFRSIRQLFDNMTSWVMSWIQHAPPQIVVQKTWSTFKNPFYVLLGSSVFEQSASKCTATVHQTLCSLLVGSCKTSNRCAGIDVKRESVHFSMERSVFYLIETHILLRERGNKLSLTRERRMFDKLTSDQEQHRGVDHRP